MRGVGRIKAGSVRGKAGLSAACALGFGLLLALPAGASGAITLTPGTNTATTPYLELDFGNDAGVSGGDANVERVDSLKWRNSAGTLGPNLTAPGLAGFCPTGTGPGHFWGQSYADHDGGSPAPVMAGSVGNWTPVGERTVELESVAPTACSGSTPVIPVQTRYTFFESLAKRNVIRVDRTWEFGPDHPEFAGTHGLRAYVPRLAIATYSQVVYPNAASNGLITTSGVGITFSTDWNNKWVALNAPATNAGLMIIRDPSNTSPATVVIDGDGGSNSNLSGVTLLRPANGWLAPLNEIEYLCFYDSTSWPVATRSATTLPGGCEIGAVPVNTHLPSVSNDEGNPQPGVTYTADPGTWENRDDTVPFAYQWLRCDGDTCDEIAGATNQDYVATNDDLGKQLRVRVTATAPGGETDTATSLLRGSLSGTIYENSATAGNELAGARVQACQGPVNAPTLCRSAIANGAAQYAFVGLPVGNYRVGAFPPGGSQAIPARRTTDSAVADGAETTGQDVVLPAPVPPPDTVDFSGAGFRGTTSEGTPILYWHAATTIDVEALIGSAVTGQVLCPGAAAINLSQAADSPTPKPGDPARGIFHFIVPPLAPLHGACTIEFEVDEEPPILFPVYIDPSGFVKTVDGVGIEDATVTLFRSDFADGVFSIVPNGDAIMSPSNRTNPDLTDSTGHFGWDVIAGYYTVRASKDGCRNPDDPDQAVVETQVYEIPPPVTDVDLRLDCDPLKVVFTGPNNLGKLKIPRSRSYALEGVTAACPDGSDAACEVALTVKSGNSKLGKSTVTVPVDSSSPLAGKLSRKGMKKLKKAGKMNTEITATGTVPDPDGADSTQVYTAKLVAK